MAIRMKYTENHKWNMEAKNRCNSVLRQIYSPCYHLDKLKIQIVPIKTAACFHVEKKQRSGSAELGETHSG